MRRERERAKPVFFLSISAVPVGEAAATFYQVTAAFGEAPPRVHQATAMFAETAARVE
jgi:hypothetical protein